MIRSAVALLLISTLAFTACSPSTDLTPGVPRSTQCINYYSTSHQVSHQTTCDGGGGKFSVNSTTDNGYTSYGTGDWTTYTASGYDTDSYGNTSGTSSGATSTNVYDGTEQWTAHVPSISSNPINITAVNGWYLQPGTNNLPGGIVLNYDATATGGSTAQFTDSLGRTWHIVGELDADGHNVDMTFTVSGVGQWVQKFDANAFAPTELASMSTTTAARIMAVRRPMSAKGVAVVAGAVAGVVGAVAGIAALIPGGQPVALVSGAVAGVAGAVAGVAAAIDFFQNQKKAKK